MFFLMFIGKATTDSGEYIIIVAAANNSVLEIQFNYFDSDTSRNKRFSNSICTF